MSGSSRVLLVVSAVLLLAGCTVTATPPASHTPPSSNPKPTVTSEAATPTPEPETVDAASYLIDGTPFVPDQDGSWKGHYAFFTDDTATVRCDVYIYSGDSGGVTCATTAGNEALATYARPSDTCGTGRSNEYDGYSIGINYKVFDTGVTGFIGCGIGESFATAPGNELPTPAVLHDNQTLFVNSPVYQYTCTVAAGVATCTDAYTAASITYGLGTAEFSE